MNPIAERPDAVAPKLMVFAHIGDLHLSDAKQRNFADLLAIVAQIEIDCASTLDFVVLPGDNADNGLPEQYALASTALKMLSVPVYAIPGDHDMEQGGLECFSAGFVESGLPRSLLAGGVRCLFLDVSGPGSGGPDFRIGADQMVWIERELRDAAGHGETSAIFMHTYPADLKDDVETGTLNAMIAAHDVALVDMGHTHYNELANDGHTIFAATRSTGQIEEGPVGYSLATIDAGVVSWRFKMLDEAFPFVIVTSPSDHRLCRDMSAPSGSDIEVRAIVFGSRSIQNAACSFDQDTWTVMEPMSDGRRWTCRMPVPSDRLSFLTVRATDACGRPGQHTIGVAGPTYVPLPRVRDGSDAARVGAWPENGILDTQLGPNRNGLKGS